MSGGPLHLPLGIGMILFLAASGWNPAARAGAEVPVFDLGSMVVLAESPEPVTGTPVETEAQEASERGDRDVVQMLGRRPGLIVSTGTKNEPELLVRGFRQEKLLVLLDGVPVTSPYQNDLDLSQMAVEDLALARVIKGNSSPLYGPNAMGGVLEMVSGVPEEGASLHLEALATDQDAWDLRGRHGFRSGPLYYVISGGRSDHDGWELSEDFQPTELEDGGERDWSAFRRDSAALRLGGRWDRSELAFSYRWIDAEKEIPVSTVSDRRIYDFPVWKMQAATVSGRLEPAPGLILRGSLYRHTWENTLVAYRDLQHDEVRWESLYDDETLGAWLQGRLLLGELGFVALGATWADAEHRDRDAEPDPWRTYAARTGSLSATATLQPVDSLTAELGLGFSRRDPTESAETPPGETIDALDPVAALAWRDGMGGEVRGSAGYRTRFPSLHELFSDTSGNPDLDPERALNLDLGYRWEGSLARWRVGAFYSRIEDLIDRQTRDDPYRNREQALIAGLELELGLRLEPTELLTLELDGHYVLTATEDGAQDDRELAHVPEHAARIEAGFELGSATSGLLGLAYHGERYEYDSDGERLTVEDALVVELQVARDLGAGFALALRARNLLDEDYRQEIGYPMPGRTLEAGLTFDL